MLQVAKLMLITEAAARALLPIKCAGSRNLADACYCTDVKILYL